MTALLPYVGLVMAVAYAIYMVYQYIRCDRLEKAKIQRMELPKTPKFSPKSYLERMDKELLRLAENAESEEKYVITLVWVWDVLRFHPDGTWEWTSRRPERDKTAKSAITPSRIINPINTGIANTASMGNMASSNEYNSLASRIAELQCQTSQIRIKQYIEECLRDSVANTRPTFTGYLESLYHGVRYEG